MKWGEWRRHCDAGLGYYWPDLSSEAEDHLLQVILDHRAMTTLMAGGPWQDKQDGGRFLHATQNGMQFKIYELFTSGIFHLIFLDRSWL